MAGERLANREFRRASVSLRGKLGLLLAMVIMLTAAVVAGVVSFSTNRAYTQLDEQQSTLLANQFQQNFNRRAAQVSSSLDQVAGADGTLQTLAELSRSSPDYSQFLYAAERMSGNRLELLEVMGNDAAIISSKQWPARYGYKEDWVLHDPPADWNKQNAFLQPIELPSGVKLAVLAVRQIQVGDHIFYLVGGEPLDRELVSSTELPRGMQALVYSADAAGSSGRPVMNGDPGVFSAIGDNAEAQIGDLAGTVERKRAPAQSDANRGSERLYAFPLFDRKQAVAAVLIVASSREQLQRLNRRIRWTAAAVAGGGVLLGIALSTLLAGRVTHPVEELAVAADQVAAGNLAAQVDDSRQDEFGRLAYAFNRMTRELLEQREKLLQSERVAAWRELARRLAHELKNPLFPLQITVENLLRAREQNPQQFEEVFREGTETLLAEIGNLKSIVARFSDFSKMPAPERMPINLNDAVRKAVRVFEPQFCAQGRPLVTAIYELDKVLEQKKISADPELLHRALSNLVLNAMDAMPQGGSLTLRTRDHDSTVQIEVADTGAGLTEEECKRLFTPYYTSKQYGTGLGLAIVQSVVSDHGGKIWVKSTPGKGTSFVIELPKHEA